MWPWYHKKRSWMTRKFRWLPQVCGREIFSVSEPCSGFGIILMGSIKDQHPAKEMNSFMCSLARQGIKYRKRWLWKNKEFTYVSESLCKQIWNTANLWQGKHPAQKMFADKSKLKKNAYSLHYPVFKSNSCHWLPVVYFILHDDPLSVRAQKSLWKMKSNPINMELLLALYCKCSGKKGRPNMPRGGRKDLKAWPQAKLNV